MERKAVKVVKEVKAARAKARAKVKEKARAKVRVRIPKVKAKKERNPDASFATPRTIGLRIALKRVRLEPLPPPKE